MDQDGHKILKIVMSRSQTGQLDERSYAADGWEKVKYFQHTNLTICKLCCSGVTRGLISPDSVSSCQFLEPGRAGRVQRSAGEGRAQTKHEASIKPVQPRRKRRQLRKCFYQHLTAL